MNKESMKNMVVLKDLPSNIVEEAIVILKPNVKLKSLDIADNKNSKTKQDNMKDPKKYIISEAEMVVSNYLSKIEKEKSSIFKTNKKIESKYKRLRAVSIFLGILLLTSCLIK